MGDGSGVVWFGAAGFEVLAVAEVGAELVVEVETTATAVGCGGCGSGARPKDRRWVTLRDAPAGDRPVLVRWRKRIWCCPEPACEVRTWTELTDLAGPRRVLTGRAAEWATKPGGRQGGDAGVAGPRLRSVVVNSVECGTPPRLGTGQRPGSGGPDGHGRLRRDGHVTSPSAAASPVRDRGGRREHRADPRRLRRPRRQGPASLDGRRAAGLAGPRAGRVGRPS